MTTATFAHSRHSSFAEYLQASMVVALLAGVVGFLAATWTPVPAGEMRAQATEIVRAA